MGTTAVDGLVFDLDNTLFDREAAFIRVAEEFYDEQLRDTASMTRDDAVAMMVRWDGDGYVSREAMFAQWLDEWPEARPPTPGPHHQPCHRSTKHRQRDLYVWTIGTDGPSARLRV